MNKLVALRCPDGECGRMEGFADLETPYSGLDLLSKIEMHSSPQLLRPHGTQPGRNMGSGDLTRSLTMDHMPWYQPA